MTRWTLGLALLCALLSNNIVVAEERCTGVVVTEVRSLAALPRELRVQLPSATRGLDGIAERGEQFNITDVVDHHLPMRRFTLAAVGRDCAVIAVERGGIAHNFELTEYHLTSTGWVSFSRSTVFSAPESVHDLLVAHRGEV